MLAKDIHVQTHQADQPARNQAAVLLRRFISGQVTNDEFEDNRPITDDGAIVAIWDSMWPFYSDMKAHKLDGRDKLPQDFKRTCVRWILFLDTKQPYLWPPISFAGLDPVKAWDESMMAKIRTRFGYKARTKKVESFANSGAYEVWPFHTLADYQHALKSPKRLNGEAHR